MENMEYCTQRLQCSDEERDACLETAAKLCHLRYQIRRYEGGADEAFREKHWNKTWGELLGETLRGWFGVEYREKVAAVLQQAE